jgi:hypothetical protein
MFLLVFYIVFRLTKLIESYQVNPHKNLKENCKKLFFLTLKKIVQ